MGQPKRGSTQAPTNADNQVDYDGTSSNVENVKILQRNLLAFTTRDQASGIGSEPDRLVGTTTISD